VLIQAGGGLHQVQFPSADHVPRVFLEGQMEADEIARAEERVQVHVPGAELVKVSFRQGSV
jgi:hypothetical protein